MLTHGLLVFHQVLLKVVLTHGLLVFHQVLLKVCANTWIPSSLPGFVECLCADTWITKSGLHTENGA